MTNLGVAIVRQYERGVVFRLGKLRGEREAGLRLVIPLADSMWKVSLRTVTMPIPSQQIITRDNASIGVARTSARPSVESGSAASSSPSSSPWRWPRSPSASPRWRSTSWRPSQVAFGGTFAVTAGERQGPR
jgi:hypothetical protein